MAYTKINWQDLPSTVTPATSENLGHMDDGIEEAHNDIDKVIDINETYANASYAGNAISGSDNAFSAFDTFSNNGNLTTSSSGITIGAGINYVMVSGGMVLQNATSNYNLTYCGITKNGGLIEQLLNEIRNSNGVQGSISLPSMTIPVQEGDVIQIYGNGDETTNIRRAYLTVKAID